MPETDMAISPKSTVILLIILIIIRHSCTANCSGNGILPDLCSLRSQSPAGIIHLNETLVNRIFKSGARPFYLIIFFDSLQLRNQPESNLKPIKSEFDLITKSFITNNQNSPSYLDKIFFCDVELNESEKLFFRFGVDFFPNIRIVPPDANDFKSDPIPVDVEDYSGLAESIADFIHHKTGVLVGAIHRPSILSKTQLGFLIGGILIWVPFMIKNIIAGETLFHNTKIWICGAMFVYFFSVSGSMFILIRRIPPFVMDRKDPNKLVFFFKGHGMQFGAEGMCVGFLFTIVGLLFSFVTRIIVKINDSMIQRLTMISAMIVSFWAVKQVVGLNHWKTGYNVHPYFPQNWYK